MACLLLAQGRGAEKVEKKIDLLEVIKSGAVEYHINPKMDFHDDPKDIFTFAADGTLTTSATKLDNALKNLPELRKVLVADGADSASSGFVDRFKDFTDLVLGSDGSFESRNKSIQTMLADNSKRQDSMSQRLSLVEARLYKQYQTLDTNLAQMNTVSTYLTQQLALMNKSSK